MSQQTWTDSIIVHLDLLNQIVHKLLVNERLEPLVLNKILELNESFVAFFLLQIELQGFKTEKK